MGGLSISHFLKVGQTIQGVLYSVIYVTDGHYTARKALGICMCGVMCVCVYVHEILLLEEAVNK